MAIEELTPVSVYWHARRGDNFTTATAQGRADATAAGYRFVRVEGWAHTAPPPDPSILAFDLYWDGARGDNFTTASRQGKEDAEAAGYRFVRPEAYVWSSSRGGETQLELFWSPQREDNYTTASRQGKGDAVAVRYATVRVEGWLVQPLQTSW
jgi:hypothetical protein